MHASRSRRDDNGVTNFYFLSKTSAGGMRALYTRQQRVEQSLKRCHHCLVSSAVVEPSAHCRHSSVVVGAMTNTQKGRRSTRDKFMTTHSLVYVSLNVTLLHYYGTYMSASAGSRGSGKSLRAAMISFLSVLLRNCEEFYSQCSHSIALNWIGMKVVLLWNSFFFFFHLSLC